jgi:hypothetical protein
MSFFVESKMQHNYHKQLGEFHYRSKLNDWLEISRVEHFDFLGVQRKKVKGHLE